LTSNKFHHIYHICLHCVDVSLHGYSGTYVNCCAVLVVSTSTDADIPVCSTTPSVTDFIDSVSRCASLLLIIYYWPA